MFSKDNVAAFCRWSPQRNWKSPPFASFGFLSKKGPLWCHTGQVVTWRPDRSWFHPLKQPSLFTSNLVGPKNVCLYGWMEAGSDGWWIDNWRDGGCMDGCLSFYGSIRSFSNSCASHWRTPCPWNDSVWLNTQTDWSHKNGPSLDNLFRKQPTTHTPCWSQHLPSEFSAAAFLLAK